MQRLYTHLTVRSIKLKKKEERRVLRGHPWIFSNEIHDDLRGFTAGEIVDVTDHSGGLIGRGYINPATLIAVRLLTRKREEISHDFLRARIAAARDMRLRLGFGNSFRAVFSEGDGLPGLIVDKYEDTLVVQSLTAGIERMLEDVITALKDVFSPNAVVLRNKSISRALEGLPLETRVAFGQVPGPVIIEESGIKYKVDVLEGQKTGFFFDQRENRQAIRDLVNGRRTLDGFCYIGAWALNAARFGASEVIGIDSSQKAVASAMENAALNGLSVKFKTADAFEELRALEKQKERFGCIILDPPAFVKSRAKVREGLKGYKEINLRAMRLLERGGALITCSCSRHIDRELFTEMLIDAAYSAGRQAKLLEMRSQSRDHPSLLAAKETQYLKCAALVID